MNTRVFQSLAASLGPVIQHGTHGCDAITSEGQRVLRRAMDAGIVRAEVTFVDTLVVVSAISIALEKDSEPASRAAHLVDLLLSGLCVR